MKTLHLFVFFIVTALSSFAQAPTIAAFNANSTTAPGFSGATGTIMTINGTNFTGATAVSFGGTPASSFTVVTSTKITAVVAGGSTGFVSVTTPAGTVTSSGTSGVFTYLPLSRIVTDFGGYWSSTTAANNTIQPDSSHNLLGFTYNGNFYSTGASDSTLTAKNISFTPGNFRAFPVSGIIGTYTTGPVYLSIANKVDGAPLTGNLAGVSAATIRSVLIDGVRGLDLGTGVTNLPTSAILTFNLSNISIPTISDAEPDILITQIADPSVGNDRFEFVDASGATVGNFLTQDMTALASFGIYKQDLFAFTPGTSYNVANPTSVFSSNGTKGIRIVGLKLSEFGITEANSSSVKSMKITPSGNSDYAFIAYNARVITAAPNISQNDAITISSVCTSSNPAILSVIGTASIGGALSYTWQRSTDGGNVWTTLTDIGNFSGATTATLTIANPVTNDKYQAIVSEAGGTTNTSLPFTITVSPLTVGGSLAGGTTVCSGTNSTTLILSGHTGTIKWQYSTDNFSNVTDVANATSASLTVTNLTAARQYRALVQSGACTSAYSTVATITVSSGGSVAGSTSVCTGTNSTVLTLSGNVGSIIKWQSSTDNFSTSTNIVNTIPTLTALNLAATTQYRAVVKYGTCTATNNSAVATVTVNPVSVGGTINGSTSVCTGTNSTTLTLSGYTGTILRWESSINSFSSVTPIANTTTSLTATDLSATTQYRAVVQSGVCAAANSTTATITVNALTVGGSIAGSTTVCSGANSTSLILNGNTGSILKWQSSTDNFSSAIADIINTTTTLVATNLTAGSQYRAIVQNGSCASATSATATINVNPIGKWIGGSTGDWNNAANWCGGIPTTPSSVQIPSGSVVTISSGTSYATTVNITPGGSLVLTGTGKLVVSAGGTFINNGTFNATGSTTGKISFAGNGSISGSTTFKNIETSGALDFGTLSTISGEFSLQPGGSVTGHSPTYICPSSTLIYNNGGTYPRSLEWPAVSSGQGLPSNIIVGNNTTINFPVAGVGYVCNDLTIENGSSLLQNFSGASAPLHVGRHVTIDGVLTLGNNINDDISLGGNWTRNSGGTFNNNGRTVIFNSAANSIISAPASATRDGNGAYGGETFYNIEINKASVVNSVALASNISVVNELKLTTGIFDPANNDVTVVSNETSTAHIAPIPALVAQVIYTGSGRFIVQRHLAIGSGSTSRRWRMLTAPLQNVEDAPTINQAWQSGVSNSNRNIPVDPYPGFGTTITKSSVYNPTDGYDQGSTNNPSIYYFNAGAWSVLPSTKVAITTHEGYMLFARGNRSIVVSTPNINANATILEPKGKIKVGDIQKSIISGYQLIGNPYASAINFNNFTFSNYSNGGATFNATPGSVAGIGITYYIWDPKTSGSSSVGRWITCSSNGNGTYNVTSNTSGLPTDGTIQSSAAFMINSDAAQGTLTIHETDKLDNSSSTGMASRGTGATELVASLSSTLLVGTGSTAAISEGVINSYHSAYHNEVDGQDAPGISSFNTSDVIRIKSQGKFMAIERRNAVADNDTIFLNLQNVSKKTYTLQFKATNMAPSLTAILEDNFKQTVTPISMADTTSVSFDVTADAKSGAADRFRIVFRQTGVLPITYSNVKAYQQNDNIAVQWSVQNELNVSKYDVEKSTNGRDFIKVNTTKALANGSTVSTYSWLDLNSVKGDNFYRIKSTSLNGSIEYSKVVKVTLGAKNSGISVYPNPVTDGTVGLQLSNMPAGDYKVIITNNNGQVVNQSNINHAGGNASQTIKPSGYLSNGNYNLEVSGAGKIQAIKILVQSN